MSRSSGSSEVVITPLARSPVSFSSLSDQRYHHHRFCVVRGFLDVISNSSVTLRIFFLFCIDSDYTNRSEGRLARWPLLVNTCPASVVHRCVQSTTTYDAIKTRRQWVSDLGRTSLIHARDCVSSLSTLCTVIVGTVWSASTKTVSNIVYYYYYVNSYVVGWYCCDMGLLLASAE